MFGSEDLAGAGHEVGEEVEALGLAREEGAAHGGHAHKALQGLVRDGGLVGRVVLEEHQDRRRVLKQGPPRGRDLDRARNKRGTRSGHNMQQDGDGTSNEGQNHRRALRQGAPWGRHTMQRRTCSQVCLCHTCGTECCRLSPVEQGKDCAPLRRWAAGPPEESREGGAGVQQHRSKRPRLRAWVRREGFEGAPGWW